VASCRIRVLLEPLRHHGVRYAWRASAPDWPPCTATGGTRAAALDALRLALEPSLDIAFGAAFDWSSVVLVTIPDAPPPAGSR
jgi:hypothetical protein